jgi:hypothetical protein
MLNMSHFKDNYIQSNSYIAREPPSYDKLFPSNINYSYIDDLKVEDFISDIKNKLTIEEIVNLNLNKELFNFIKIIIKIIVNKISLTFIDLQNIEKLFNKDLSIDKFYIFKYLVDVFINIINTVEYSTLDYNKYITLTYKINYIKKNKMEYNLDNVYKQIPFGNDLNTIIILFKSIIKCNLITIYKKVVDNIFNILPYVKLFNKYKIFKDEYGYYIKPFVYKNKNKKIKSTLV